MALAVLFLFGNCNEEKWLEKFIFQTTSLGVDNNLIFLSCVMKTRQKTAVYIKGEY